MDKHIERILNENNKNINGSLQKYIEKVSQNFEFPELNVQDRRQELWNRLYNIINTTNDSKSLILCFNLIRIISREKANLNEIITQDWMELLNYHACLTKEKKMDDDNKDVALETLKALYNVIFNSKVAVAMAAKNGTLNGILEYIKIKNSKDFDLKMLNMKIFFLITALCSEVRYHVKNEMHGIECLLEELQCVISKDNLNHNADMKYSQPLTDKEVDYCCEILKVLFNVTFMWNGSDTIEEEEENLCIKVVEMMRELLLRQIENDKKKYDLHINVANLITNMPNKCLIALKLNYENQNTEIVDKDMIALDVLLELLEKKLGEEQLEATVTGQYGFLSPILTVFLSLAHASRMFRKYLRLKILPPLRDVHTRPEKGKTLRNYLCKLLTSPITQVKSMAADLLFKLCKENVGRLIKYTGYGNAAGLLASRGLLGGRSYSSSTSDPDSTDSETEEYNKHKHGINPVLGCYEEPRPNPLEGMSEEQKEYEVMKLVNLIDNMTKAGIVKPCKIGADGRPKPISHVLELQNELQEQQIHQSDEESD